VHRTLETLCRIGEARKVTALHDSARYDGNLTPHHHVICVRCRRIRDVEIAGLGQLFEQTSGLEGFEPLGWSLEVQALCEACRSEKSGERRRPKSAVAGSKPARGVAPKIGRETE
jgi:Fur family peroxide stress response transcriptional regulator